MPAPRTNASHDQNRVPTLIGVSTADGTTPVPAEVNPTTGAVLVSGVTGTLVTAAYDYVSVAYPIATTEIYSFYTGGSGGLLVATVTVVYTDSTKASLSTATRT